MIELQIVSDLHVEFWAKKKKFNFIKPSAQILALLGDICCCGSDDDFDIFKRFICEILPKYEKILFVAGNHEYYYNPPDSSIPSINNTMMSINSKIKLFFKQTSDKLYFLNNSAIQIEDGKTTYNIIGSTLWSWIPKEQRNNIQQNMNDYKYIYVNDNNSVRNITADEVANIHLKDYKYIKSQIIKSKKAGYKVIVLTHHKPYLKHDFDHNSLDVAYQSDLSSLFESPVLLWAYGHTHIADNSMQKKTWLFSNPKGYPNQKLKYNKALSVKV